MVAWGEVGGGGREDVNGIFKTCFLIYCSLLGDFCSENIIFKKIVNENVAKNPKGTFLQIQTETKSTAITRISKCYVLTAS